MSQTYTLKLAQEDIFQILDALESRAIVWGNTVLYANGQSTDTSIAVAEHRDADEAELILSHYREIIVEVTQQVRQQQSKGS